MTSRSVIAVAGSLILAALAWPAAVRAADTAPAPLTLLFLGDDGPHQPAIRFKQLQPVLKRRHVNLVYTNQPADLNPQTLNEYDGLILYANIDRIEDSQARSLLEYVAEGKGFIPLHCASFCFRNNDDVVALIGAQFLKHGTGTFRTIIKAPRHPVMQGFGGFESYDETYLHTRHNPVNRVVLETRTEGDVEEPWTWVRTHGKGRVFYTAWGHDTRTWSNPGYQNLVERGIRWACGDDPAVVPPFRDRAEMTKLAQNLRPFEYVETDEIPVYPSEKSRGASDPGSRKLQLPATPAESLRHFITPVGFEVRLFASEENFEGKPIAMNWDERGRLWICETVDYPNELNQPGHGRDRIRICADTDGDEIADEFTVFAHGLSIPTALTFYRGGAIVQDGAETIYLQDTNGDGRADLRKVLITGWALQDTHGGVSNFQYGLDNWYYGMQGYNPSRPVLTNGKEVTPFRQGFFRFKVAGEGQNTAVTELEFLRSTNNNTWGLGLSEEGLVFGSTANGNPSDFLPIPNRYYEAVRGWSATVLGGIADSNQFHPLDDSKVRQVDHHGGFTAASGHALYTARNYPREYWNRAAFVAEPTGHLIATFFIRADGAGFRSRNAWNLIGSDDEWSAPVMAEVGPDGNVWFLDWYNYIVQHNPTPAGFKTGKGNAYETSLRDKKHGRIYRLVYTGDSPRGSSRNGLDLSQANGQQLVAALADDNFFWRRHAQRLIVEAKQFDALPELRQLLSDPAADELGLNVQVIHALWCLQGRNALAADADLLPAVLATLRHPSAGVRRNALQVLPKTAATLQAILASGVVHDDEPQVQLAGLLAIADAPPASAAALLLTEILSGPAAQDRWLKEAAISAAARNALPFLTSALRQSGKPALPAEALAIVAEHFARGNPAETVGQVLNALGEADAGAAVAVMTGLARGWPRDEQVKVDAATEDILVALLKNSRLPGRAALVTFATRLGSEKVQMLTVEIAQSFLAVAQDDAQTDEARVAAALQFVELQRRDAKVVEDLLVILSPRLSAALAGGLVAAIGRSEAPEAAKSLLDALTTQTPAVRQSALTLLLTRADWTETLLRALDKGEVSAGDLSLDQKQALANHPNKDLAKLANEILARGSGLPNPDRQKTIDELAPLVERSGDAAAGKAVFKVQCAQCHTHSGEGAKIGPDLTGMAVHPKRELLTHIIDPSRSVEGNFRLYSVLLQNGFVVSGLLSSESKTAIEIVDAKGKTHAIQREDIEELVASTKSLMPEGFEKLVKPLDIANLLEFLTQRGKYLPIPIARAATIVSTKPMFQDGEHDEQKLIFSDWTPKVFDGVPFLLIDPRGDQVPNAIMLHGSRGDKPPRMPRSVTLPCNSAAVKIHFLGGISGWGAPASPPGTPSVTIRLHYEDGTSEDHVTKNGQVWADYIRRIDVPESRFAYAVRGQQVRYFSIAPKSPKQIKSIELVKGEDVTSPLILAITVEGP